MMDFLDPQKARIRQLQLYIGYILIGILLLLGTTILLYQARGFGLDRNGHIYQNGFIFLSSTPGSATIYVDGVQKGTTNTHLIIPAGQYIMQLKRNGYRTWQRAFNVEGQSVQHFDYPFLFPTSIDTTTVKNFGALPPLTMQSLDRRWLLVQEPTNFATFDEYDVTNPKSVVPSTVTIPASVLSSVPAGQPQSLQVVEWSNDNRHVLLKHVMSTGNEYIMLDRQNPDSSINLTNTLHISPTNISLYNQAYNQYYIYTANDETLSVVTLSNSTPQPVLTHVLSYKAYGTNIILYISDSGVPNGQVSIRLKDGTTTYNIQDVPVAPTYLLDLAQNSGHWFVADGASSENKVYIYKDPEQQLNKSPALPVVPIDILKVQDPNYLAISADTRMIMVENGTQFAVYDDFADKDYTYTLSLPLDAPQTHASWMDGERIDLVSQGKATVFDYDDTNVQQLESADPSYPLLFDRDYKALYSLAPNQKPQTGTNNTAEVAALPGESLTLTQLRAPQDR